MARKPHPARKSNGHAPGLGERVHTLGRTARSFKTQVRGTAEEFGRAFDMRRRVRRHPYAMVAAALGVGYVLGGGLFSRTTARLLGVVGKVATLPVIRGELVGLAAAILSGADISSEEEGGSAEDLDESSPA